MNLLQKIFNRLNGLYYPQEYLCLATESFPSPLHAWLADDRKAIKDITKLHLFVGYHPLILALPALREINLEQQGIIHILFTEKNIHSNENLDKKDAIACLTLKRIDPPNSANAHPWYFEGLIGEHRFLSSFHQAVIRLNNNLNNKKAGNIFLKDNLYTQVQIAYSIPRNISLITIEEKDKFNLFPTDLHGKLDDEHYIVSLRHDGKACQQVQQAKKILITQVQSQFYKTAYALGKNHMKDPQERQCFPFSNVLSSRLRLPLPEASLFCRELELQDSFVHGIHRLLRFRILSSCAVQQDLSTLAHIHNSYATWRHNNGLAGNYLLR